MSMTTFYVLLSKDGTQCLRVAPSTSADEACRFFALGWSASPGEIYAARMSDGAAAIVKQLADSGQSSVANRTLKLYSHSLIKVGDVT